MVSLPIVVFLIIFFESLLLFFFLVRRLLYFVVFAIHCVVVVNSINKKSIFETYVKIFKANTRARGFCVNSYRARRYFCWRHNFDERKIGQLHWFTAMRPVYLLGRQFSRKLWRHTFTAAHDIFYLNGDTDGVACFPLKSVFKLSRSLKSKALRRQSPAKWVDHHMAIIPENRQSMIIPKNHQLTLFSVIQPKRTKTRHHELNSSANNKARLNRC